MERFPPLNAVRAFEAVARHLSITAASEELHVTAGAVSRQIKTLEEFLGQALFVRGHRQISLTRAGTAYFKEISRAMVLIRDATKKAGREKHRQRLKIRAYTTFAVRWLIPRLSTFHALHPNIEVLIKASLDPVDFRREDIDAAVRLGDGVWPGAKSVKLVANILAPVMSPALLRNGPKLWKPTDLVRHTLLHAIARPDDWRHWLKSVRAESVLDVCNNQIYESSVMSYAAAVEGQGIAMAQMFLVEKDIAEGRLVLPFDSEVDMGDFTYYLLQPTDMEESESLRTFKLWLLSQLQNPRAGRNAAFSPIGFNPRV